MAANADTGEALRYHRATNHSWESVRDSGHRLDWANKPLLYKVYPNLEPLPLPREMALPGLDALRALRTRIPPDLPAPVDLGNLATLLFLSGGITKKLRHGGQEHPFRAASCAGALYPVEIYPVVGSVEGLEPGVYHFNPADFALRRLRSGDLRAVLVRAAASEEMARAPVALVFSAIFWRSAWKYQARCYRYCFWDSGTIGANLLATAAALGLPCRFHLGFADAEVNRLIGADGRREAALALATVGGGRGASTAPNPPPDAGELALETVPLSRRERAYPELERMHEASSLSAAEVAAWRQRAPAARPSPPRVGARPLEPAAGSTSLAETIRRRGSTRRFAREPVSFGQMSAILDSSTRGVPADFLPEGGSLLDVFLNVHAVEGLEPGAYRFHPGRGLVLLKPGDFRSRSGYLCLEQPLGADASATVFFMADLGAILERFGNRGYRAAQFEAGVVGGRMYLAAYGLGLGATGLTFYDEDVTEFFRPDSEGRSCIFVVALGVPAYGKERDPPRVRR